jgi:uncharacterized protein YcbX
VSQPAEGVPRVTRLSVTAVKGTRLLEVEEIALGPEGARGNRRFFVIDDRDRMVNAKNLGSLQTIVAHCLDDRLRLEFPNGSVVEDDVALGAPLSVRFFSRQVEARPLQGGLSAAVSDHVGRSLRIVEGPPAVDRGVRGGASLISQASLSRLAEVATEASLDPRRFRMLVEIDGVGSHEEDRWVGATVRIGDAVVRFHGHVGRCLITSRDPESGEVTLPTLDLLGEYRRDVDATEPLPFGIYGEVVQPALVRLGDAVAHV